MFTFSLVEAFITIFIGMGPVKVLLVYIAMTPAIAYKVNDNLSLGAGLSFTYNYSKSVSRVNNPGPGVADGKLTFEAGALSISPSISMLYEFNEQTTSHHNTGCG